MSDLLSFMHCCGFDWICAIRYENGIEYVASKMNDSDELWWRPLEVEGSGFTQLFKGSIENVFCGTPFFEYHLENSKRLGEEMLKKLEDSYK